MKFHEFLRHIRTNKNVANVKDHYQKLGGEKKLGIALRTFQHVSTGKFPPSAEVMAAVFAQTSGGNHRAFVLSYMNTVLEDKRGTDLILEYLEQYLAPGVEQEKKSIWETTKHHMMYSDQQLDYLNKNPEAMRFHKRVLLLDKIPLTDCRLPEKKLGELIELKLVEKKRDERTKMQVIAPSRTLYRIPNFENSSPRSVAFASDYIMNHMENYISKEGSSNQELSYAMQMVERGAADRILEQARAFKRWVQSLAQNKDGKDMVPFIFVGFSKKLQEKEI